MPKAKVCDINMYYEVHGTGEPLVFIAGLGSNLTIWFRHIPVFSKEYKCIIFDNRGAGRSDAPDMTYTLEIMADDVAGLLDTIGVKLAHIIGVSMGGGIAQAFTIRYPKKVRSLILASTDCGGVHGVPPGAEYMNFVTGTGRDPTETIEDRRKKSMSFVFTPEFEEKSQEIIKEIQGKLMEFPTSPQIYMKQSQAFSAFDSYDRLPEIKAPTLIMHGEVDPIVATENAHILASRIPGAELVILENKRHGILYEAFDETSHIMLDFLKRHCGSG
jgi:3-oxoadipate enol-lactonase